MHIVTHHILVPRTLRPVSELATNSSVFKAEMEDYISLSKSITYRLHPKHIDTKKTTITVSISKELYKFLLPTVNSIKDECEYSELFFTILWDLII